MAAPTNPPATPIPPAATPSPFITVDQAFNKIGKTFGDAAKDATLTEDQRKVFSAYAKPDKALYDQMITAHGKDAQLDPKQIDNWLNKTVDNVKGNNLVYDATVKNADGSVSASMSRTNNTGAATAMVQDGVANSVDASKAGLQTVISNAKQAPVKDPNLLQKAGNAISQNASKGIAFIGAGAGKQPAVALGIAAVLGVGGLWVAVKGLFGKGKVNEETGEIQRPSVLKRAAGAVLGAAAVAGGVYLSAQAVRSSNLDGKAWAETGRKWADSIKSFTGSGPVRGA